MSYQCLYCPKNNNIKFNNVNNVRIVHEKKYYDPIYSNEKDGVVEIVKYDFSLIPKFYQPSGAGSSRNIF